MNYIACVKGRVQFTDLAVNDHDVGEAFVSSLAFTLFVSEQI